MTAPTLATSNRPPTPPADLSIPSGIYVHLPYCRSRCGYCSFVVSTDESTSAAYLEALKTEMALVEPEAEGAAFDSLYLGGGTPSLTPPADLDRLLGSLASRFSFRTGAEVTLEANPEDVTPEKARLWSDSGITRVSVGVQSFEDGELAAIGRRHDSARAASALEILTGFGFAVSGDLILGLPEQTREGFAASLSRLAESGASHVSIYLLEAEKSKTLEEDRRHHPSRYLSDDSQADAWLEMGRALSERGFRHYEISNWALPRFEARHNVKYWRRTPTLGLGVSAHEFWGGRRRAIVSSLPRYLEEAGSGRRPLASDRAVGPDEEARERIILGLRLSEGVPAGDLKTMVRESADPTLAGDYAAWHEEGLLEEDADRIRLTERGYLLSNEILCRFV